MAIRDSEMRSCADNVQSYSASDVFLRRTAWKHERALCIVRELFSSSRYTNLIILLTSIIMVEHVKTMNLPNFNRTNE
ncbi:hypothetical protein JB92DRAFT_3072672 [Gautieria morchelliformis]|nr:hypothetical protein JB92DRAFT_3072672 [Gautieria morchelliformis]